MTDATVGMIYPARGHRGTSASSSEYGHPSHRGFARAIGARDIVLAADDVPDIGPGTVVTDLVASLVSHVPECDAFVTENDSALYVTPRLSHQYPDAAIVHLAASGRLIGGERNAPDQPGDAPAGSGPHEQEADELDRSLLRRFLRRYCDCVVAVSDFVAERLRPHVGDPCPIRVVNPYVQPDVFEALETVVPDLSGKVAVTVSQWRAHKGIDMLVEAWPAVRARHPEAELRIVGPGHPPRYVDTDDVSIRGLVPSLATEFAAASVYVHPAYTEPFGVSVVEAMRAGLPPIVTETTGAKSAVQPVDASLVVEPTPSALADAIATYFESSERHRRTLSEASRRHSRPYTERRQTDRFRRSFRSVLEDIG